MNNIFGHRGLSSSSKVSASVNRAYRQDTTTCVIEDWKDCVCMVIASGPSVSQEDIETIERWKEQDVDSRKVIVTNTMFKSVPWADALFFHDIRWWIHYRNSVSGIFRGKIYSIQEVRDKRVNRVGSDEIVLLGNSGAAAIGMCILFNAKEVYVVGVDCRKYPGKVHSHGDHPLGIGNAMSIGEFPKHFSRIAEYAKEKGAVVTNLSRSSILTCFPKGRLEDYIC